MRLALMGMQMQYLRQKINLRKVLDRLFILMAALILSGCAQVQIQDSTWCSFSGRRGSCFNTLTPKTQSLSWDQWDVYIPGKVCTSAETFADWKSAIEKLCSICKNCCTYEQLQTVQKFMNNVNAASKAK